MKLSEAILLGSTVLAPKAGIQYSSTPEAQYGCALGMAAIANACSFVKNNEPIPKGDSARSLGTAGVWGEWVREETRRPCSCWFLMPRTMPVQEVITHIFDHHIMGKRHDWSLDQLVEWVRTVEPAGASAVQIPSDDHHMLHYAEHER
jgi:hypothetical protein